MMKKSTRISVVMISFVLAITLTILFTVSLPAHGQPVSDSTLEEYSETPITVQLNLGPDEVKIDPVGISWGDYESIALNDQLLLGLVRKDDDTGDPLPELATTWEVSQDARVFTFTLRSDAYWTDGTPVTAGDVRYGILRNLDPELNAGWAYPLFVIENAEGYYNGDITDPNQVGITVLDDIHIRFDLNRSTAHFLSILTNPTAKPLPEWAISDYGDSWTQANNIVSNGPYELQSSVINMEKSATYYGAGDVQIEHVSFWHVDTSTGWEMYQAGTLDSAQVPNDQWAAAQSDPILGQELSPGFTQCTYYYGFNTTKEPFDDPLARKAFIAAVDRQAVIDEVLYAQQPALTFTPPGVFGHVDGYSAGIGIPHNPAQAQTYLADAGYPGGVGLPPITLVYNTSEGHTNIATAVQQDWLDTLGVSVTLVDMEWNAYLDLLNTDPPQVWRLGWCGDHPDAYNFLYDAIVPAKARFGNWTNLTYEGLLNSSTETLDNITRLSLYESAEEILVETDAVMLPLYYYANGIATKPYLERSFSAGGLGGWIADWQFTQIIDGATDTLDLYLGPDEVEIDPAGISSTDYASIALNDQLLLGLVRKDDDAGVLLPNLADSWMVSWDARVFTFTLRSDAYWTDGTPVTAGDVRYGILRNLDPELNAAWAYPLFVIENAEGYKNGDITDPNLVGITVLDSTKIQFDLNQSAAYFPSILTIPAAKPLPQWAIEMHGDNWTQANNIVSNGPYELQSSVINMEKSATYYGAGDVQIENVGFWQVDISTGWEMYQAGILDSAQVPYDQWTAAQADPILGQELSPGFQPCTYYYGFNTAKEPFDDPLVRKAFIAAVDRQGMIDEALAYAQEPSLTFTPPGIFGHVDGSTAGIGIPHNPAQAQTYLADAGYPSGVGLPPITLVYNTGEGHTNIATAMQQDWLDTVGVSVSLSDLDWSAYMDLLSTDPPQVWRLGWCGDYPDAYNFLFDAIVSGKARFGNWTNLTYEVLLDTATVTADPGTRLSLYESAEEILVETDAVMLPLYYYAYGIATKPYLDRTFSAGGLGGWIADWQFTKVSTAISTSGGTLASFDGNTTIDIPPGGFTDTIILSHSPAYGVDPNGRLAGFGQTFEMRAVFSDTGQIAQPIMPYSIQISYNEAELGVIPENTLRLYYWSGTEWILEESSLIDTVNNHVTATPNHFSVWAVFGEVDKIHLPLIKR